MSNQSTMRAERPALSQKQFSQTHDETEDLTELLSEISVAVERYCNSRPKVVAGIIFSLGFIVGWKAKPW